MKKYILRKQNYNVERFIKAQELDYNRALQEVKDGCKCSHWIWYIFPQLYGLGGSDMSIRYSITCLGEAETYIRDYTLSLRLREITSALLAHKGKKSAYEIFGTLDAMKVRSCMTLFDYIRPNEIFGEVLDAFYDGQRCPFTIEKAKKMPHYMTPVEEFASGYHPQSHPIINDNAPF